jgi:hypothetical protein
VLENSKKRFLEILKLVEYIPIVGELPSNGWFAANVTSDSEFYFQSIQRNGSFRDIVKLMNKELEKEKQPEHSWRSKGMNSVLLESTKQRSSQLREIGCSYPVEYLLFDFCLAALDGDLLDAGLYLAHSFHLIGLSKSLNLLLSVIVNEQLVNDTDARELIIRLARSIEPRNADAYVDTYGGGFRKRYEKYKEELRSKVI